MTDSTWGRLPVLDHVAKMVSASGFLVVYLEAIDERLLDYLDEEDELRHEVVKCLRYYASALPEASITPAAAAGDRADWFPTSSAPSWPPTPPRGSRSSKKRPHS